MATLSSTARFEARISTDLHALLKRAAEVQGRTVTDFGVSAVQEEAACRAIEQVELLNLSRRDQALFAQALMTPPKETAAMKRAFARRRKLLGD